MSQSRALPGPHRDELRSFGLLCRAGDISHEVALERIWQNFHARNVHRLKQPILNTASESSREATRERRVTRLATEQSLAMRLARARFFTREKRRPNLHAFCAEHKSGHHAPSVGDAPRRHD